MMLLFLEEVNKKMNSTAQHSLFVSSKWCDWTWASCVASLAIYVIWAPVLMEALITTWTQAIRPFRGSHAANKGIDWLLGQFSHKGTEHGSFEKPNGLATQPVPLQALFFQGTPGVFQLGRELTLPPQRALEPFLLSIVGLKGLDTVGFTI